MNANYFSTIFSLQIYVVCRLKIVTWQFFNLGSKIAYLNFENMQIKMTSFNLSNMLSGLRSRSLNLNTL